MLVAILTGNRRLAEKCNMLRGEPVCIYRYVQEQAGIYLSKNYPELCAEAPEAFNFIKTSRKAQKFALMCFFYNQKHLSRTSTFKNRFEEFVSRGCTDVEFRLFSMYSVKYSTFIDTIFPGLNEQLDLLEEAMLLLVGSGESIQVHTLDDCIIH